MSTVNMIAMAGTSNPQCWLSGTCKILLLLLPADTGFETTRLWGLAFALTLTGNVTAFLRAFCQLSFTPTIIKL